jgi:hypothetical protein
MEPFEGHPFVKWQKEWRGEDSLDKKKKRKEVGPKGKLCTLNRVFFMFTTWGSQQRKMHGLSIYA